jgi:hypothetical protein
MVRVVDAQGYHLRWIEVPVEEVFSQVGKNRPAGRGPAEGVM